MTDPKSWKNLTVSDIVAVRPGPPKRTRKRVYYSKCALCGKVGRTSGPNPAGIINGLVFGKPGWMFVHVSCYNKQVQIPIRRAG